MAAFMSREALALTLATGVALPLALAGPPLWKKGQSRAGNPSPSTACCSTATATACSSSTPRAPPATRGRPRATAPRPTTGSEVTAPHPPPAALRHGRARRRPAAVPHRRTLLDAGAGRIGEKLREEADELARHRRRATRVASRADVVYPSWSRSRRGGAINATCSAARAPRTRASTTRPRAAADS